MKSPRPSLWLVPLGLSLYINVILLTETGGASIETLKAIAGPLATLFTGVIGLGAIAWQAHLGFENLRKGQIQRAKIERSARHDQHRYDNRRRAAEANESRALLASTLAAEIATIQHVLRVYLGSMRAKKSAVSTKYFYFSVTDFSELSDSIEIPQDIFKGNLANIGLLGHQLAADVVGLYFHVERNNLVRPSQMKERSHYLEVSDFLIHSIELDITTSESIIASLKRIVISEGASYDA